MVKARALGYNSALGWALLTFKELKSQARQGQAFLTKGGSLGCPVFRVLDGPCPGHAKGTMRR